MLISLDYDDTYSLDPPTWDKVIDLFHQTGHEVMCVTMRYAEEGQELELTIGKKCTIIYTGRKAKKPYLQKVRMEPDVWIDDSAEWILYDAR